MPCGLSHFLAGLQSASSEPYTEQLFTIEDRLFFESHLTEHPDCIITVETSGTTGSPRSVAVETQTLWAASKRDDRNLFWFVTYPRKSMGLLQLKIHAIRNSHGLSQTFGPQINAIATTPSLFRKMLFTGELEVRNLQQVTFGGEHADQRLLDMAKSAFPDAKITHTYASSELGQVFSSSDGLEGYPERLLHKESSLKLALDSLGELVAEYPNGKQAQTGDLFETSNGRILFKGRKDDSGVVAGSIVFPHLLTQLIRGFDEVTDARSWLQPNPITNSVLACEVVSEGDQGELANAITRQALSQLGRPYKPARIDFVPELNLAKSGKA